MALETFGSYLTLPPNWGTGIRVAHKWQTNVKTSITGVEQRSALLTCPRYTQRYTLDLLDSSEVNWFNRTILNHLHEVFGVPIWPDRTTLSAQALAGQKDLVCVDADNRRFEAGRPCILIDPTDYTSYEVGEIASIAGDTITLVNNLTSTWAAGVDVYPLLAAMLDTPQSTKTLTDAVASARIEANSIMIDVECQSSPGGEDEDFWPEALTPNWVNPLGFKTRHPYNVLEYLGVATLESNWDRTASGWSAEFLLDGKTEIQSLIDFFDENMGRWGSFFVPTWRSDVTVTDGFASDARILTIEDCDYYNSWWKRGGGKFIEISFPDGTIVQRGVANVLTATTIRLNDTVGKACAAADVGQLRVSHLRFARFDIDELEIHYETENVARVRVSFSSLPADTDFTVMTTTTTTTSSSSTTTSSTASSTSTESTTSTLSTSSTSSTYPPCAYLEDFSSTPGFTLHVDGLSQFQWDAGNEWYEGDIYQRSGGGNYDLATHDLGCEITEDSSWELKCKFYLDWIHANERPMPRIGIGGGSFSLAQEQLGGVQLEFRKFGTDQCQLLTIVDGGAGHYTESDTGAINVDTWYYVRMWSTGNKQYHARVATGNYDNNGGSLTHSMDEAGAGAASFAADKFVFYPYSGGYYGTSEHAECIIDDIDFVEND